MRIQASIHPLWFPFEYNYFSLIDMIDTCLLKRE